MARARDGWLGCVWRPSPGRLAEGRPHVGRARRAPFTGGSTRAACTRTALSTSRGHIDDATVRAALRSHRGLHPLDGARMQMPCAHATWLPTRRAGQTTGSLVAALGATTTRVLATGTSSPCLSVFKQVPLGGDPVNTGPPPGTRGADAHSLWFAHERLHRAVLRDHDVRRLPFDEARRALETRALTATSPAAASAAWAEHRAAVDAWRAEAERVRPRRPPGLHGLFLARTSRRDGLA